MWICSQIGAREHYAIPRALHKAGRLDTLYTDFWAGRALRRAQKMVDGRLKIGALRSLAARYHPEMDTKSEILKAESRNEIGEAVSQRLHRPGKAEIVSWNFRALWWEGMLLRKKQRLRKQKAETGKEVRGQRTEDSGLYYGFIEVGRRFAIRVRESLKRRPDLNAGTIFFAYDTGALESMEWCRERGIKCVLNQMDPSRVEVDLVRSEEKQWPGWALEDIQVPEAYFVRREKEWALADRVVVNSEFSSEALLQQGVPPEKLVVIPLCYEVGDGKVGDGRWEIGDGKAESRKQKVEIGNRKSGVSGQKSVVSGQWSSGLRGASPLRVLFLGQVILRKGIQYLLAAARDLERENIRFDVVGSIGISRMAMATAPGNVTFHGRTGREQAADWYRRSQLFVLPTLSDGFGITQLEAMAHGLPVIATPCCGEVVSDGVDGFIVPPRDAGALMRTFRRYLAQPEVLSSQSAAARVKAGHFTLDRLAANLRKVEEELEDGR
jgi:glycosyltransferase involved in cell wall biosynthesis